MTGWSHRHIIDLSSFSLDDYAAVLELAKKFDALPSTGLRKLPALQGRIISTLFFEPSTRTRSSFELAAKRLSADVISFSSSTSALKKGESIIDTALTYQAMGANILVVRHKSNNVPAQIASELDKLNLKAGVINAGDGLHSHPSQGLLDLYTLSKFFNHEDPTPNALEGKCIAIVGDVMHSRVARSNLWALTGCGANVILCGPESLLPNEFKDFVANPPPGQRKDPIGNRGKVKIERVLKTACKDADAIMTLRLQKERMQENYLSDLDSYHNDYGISLETLNHCKKNIPVLHPGPVNRGVEISGTLLDKSGTCLIHEQVCNSIPVRMAILYLVSGL